MTSISVTVDAKQVLERLQGLERQAPFAISVGINTTVEHAQKVMQNRMPQVFQLRGTETLFRQAVKVSFTTKRRLVGNIRIEGPQSGGIGVATRIGQMILRHEDGGTRTGNAPFFVRDKLKPKGFTLPVEGLRTGQSNPPRAIYPVNIGATLRLDPGGNAFRASNQKGKKRARGQQGRERSFFATEKGIYERRFFGSMSAVRLLWAFERTITLRPTLQFYPTVQEAVDAVLIYNLDRAIEDAIRTAFQGPVPRA